MKKQILFFLALLVSSAAMWLISGCGKPSAPPPMSYWFHYDKQGRFSGGTDGNGQTVNYRFDKKERLTTVRFPDGKMTLRYDANDNVTQVKDNAGVISYRYDAFDRLVEATYKYSPQKRIQYDYDPMERISAVKVVGAKGLEYEVRYEYDILGNLLAVDDGEGRTEYTYYPEQRQIVRRLPNGITTTFTFSALGEGLSIRHTDASGQLIAAYEYEHDVAGNVISVREETVEGVKVTRYEWDKRGYLSALHLPDGSTERYEYDAMGNRIAKITPTGTIRYEYDQYGRLIRAGNDTYKYDRVGNLIDAVENGKRTQLQWDSRGGLVEVRLPSERIRYKYDTMGNLVSRGQGKDTTHFLPNPLAPVDFTLAEFDRTGRLKQAYLYGDSLLGCRDAIGQKRYFIEDGFSSIRHITDSRGQVVGRQDYSLFSEVIRQWGEQAGGFRVAGERWEPATQYWFIGGRVYGAKQGRYITPVVNVANLLRPDSINSYAHACLSRGTFAQPRCNQTKKFREREGGITDLDYSMFRGYDRGFPTFRMPGAPGGFFAGMIGQGVASRGGILSFKDVWNFYRLTGEPEKLPFNLLEFLGRNSNWIGYRKSGGIWIRRGELGDTRVPPLSRSDNVARTHDINIYLSRNYPVGAKVTVEGPWGPEEFTVLPEWKAKIPPFHLLLQPLPPLQWKGRRNVVQDAGRWFLNNLHNIPILDFIFPTPAEGSEVDYMAMEPIKSAQKDLGGVELSGSAQFLGQLGHITGLVYDKDSDRLMLVGDGDIHLPPIDLSYFAIADSLVREGYTNIWFSLDPYEPKNPRGPWLKCVWGPADLLPGSPAGTVMFDADWLLKQYSFGVQVDKDGTVSPRISQVPGFKDMFTLGFERSFSRQRETWNRFWIIIGDVIIRRSGNALVIEDVKVQVMTERMYATSKGLESSGGERDPDAETFAKFFEEHYDEFAKESPQLAHLKELGKVFGLVKWLHSNRIPISVDPQWVQNAGGLERQYVERVSALSRQQQRTKQYRSGNALITETRVIHIFGGDAVQTEPREIQDDGSAARLSGIMQNARVGKLERPDVSIEAGGKQLTAVVLPLTTNGKQLWDNAKAPTTVERQGVTYHFGPDRKVKYAEDDFGTRIDYRRDNKGNLTGYQAKSSDGWASVASSQSFGTQLAITSPRKDRFSYCWNAEDYLTDVIVNDKPFARCAYDPAQRTANMSYAGHIETLTFDSDNRLQNWMVEQTIGKAGTKGSLTMNYDSDGQITNVRTDTGDKLEVAYENGTVRSIRTAGNEVEYSWSDNKRLASVRSGDLSANYAYDGDSLREVNIQRGDAVASAIFENGLLQKVSDLSGGAWSYRYDTQDALIAVRDATGAEGRYSYDADGRLTDVRLPGGGRLQYVYEQLASKEGKGNGAAEGVRLIGVTFSPEGQGLPFQGHAKTQRTFPWGASGLAGLAVFVSLAAIWWYRRWPETRR